MSSGRQKKKNNKKNNKSIENQKRSVNRNYSVKTAPPDPSSKEYRVWQSRQNFKESRNLSEDFLMESPEDELYKNRFEDNESQRPSDKQVKNNKNSESVKRKKSSETGQKKSKNNKKKSSHGFIKFIIVTALIAALVLVIKSCISSNSKEVKTDNSAKSSENVTTSDNSEKKHKKVTETTTTTSVTTTTLSVEDAARALADFDKPLSSSMQINVEPILQKPELPTGCEITSLTMVLNFYGYNVDKTTMADDYLIRTQTGTDFTEAFIGSPYDKSSFGCFAPVIKNTAIKFFNDQPNKMNAADISGQTLEHLFHYIDKGYPVITWATIGMHEANWTTYFDGPNGKFPNYEHCLVLTGYDFDQNIVYVDDPLRGATSYDLELFEQRYIDIKRQAVLIF